MKSEIEQALLVLEHTERSTLVDCGADKRIRQLFKTTSTRRKAQDFDKSEMSPTKLAKLSHNQGRSALLGAEFCTDLVLETCDVEAAGALASTCGLARVRCEPKLKAWKTLRRKIQNADLGTIETILDKYVRRRAPCAGRSVVCRPWAARAWPTSTVGASRSARPRASPPNTSRR